MGRYEIRAEYALDGDLSRRRRVGTLDLVVHAERAGLQTVALGALLSTVVYRERVSESVSLSVMEMGGSDGRD